MANHQSRGKWRFGNVLGLALLAGALAVPGAIPGAEATETAAESRRADDPLQLIVSLNNQALELWRGTTLVIRAPISSGRRGHGTPRGIFSVLEKRRHHKSNLYDDAPMPYMQRLTWSGIALHQGDLPGYPASHGCIRLTKKTASRLFSMLGLGTHVVITRGEQRPQSFAHRNLPVPAAILEAQQSARPPRTASLATDGVFVAALEEGAKATSGKQVSAVAPLSARSDKPLRVLITRRSGRERIRDMQVLLNRLGQSPGPIDGWMGRKTSAAIAGFQVRMGLPVDGKPTEAVERALYKASGLSLSQRPGGHIHVHQGFKPVFDAPIDLAGGDSPLGTHIFTLQGFLNDDPEVRWTALTVEPAASMTPALAMDRVLLPADVKSRLRDLLTPGSSIIVTDHGINRETSLGTDFVVLTR